MGISTKITTDIVIDAPIDLVWSVLVDFEKYHEWNDFCPKVDVRTGEGRNELAVGDDVNLYIKWIGSTKEFVQKAVITLYDKGNYTFAWGATVGASFLLRANRVQSLEMIDMNNKTKYSTCETFTGMLVHIVTGLYGKKVQNGFNFTAEALKARCESMK